MTEDRKRLIDSILYFLCLIIIFIVVGYYSIPDNLLLISGFFPVVFIPILLLIAYKGKYNQTNQLIYFVAIFSSLLFYILIAALRKTDLLKVSNIVVLYFAILLFSFMICLMIHLFSYSLIAFFGMRFDDKIIDNLKTISCPIKSNVEEVNNLVDFILIELLGFEYKYESNYMDAYVFERGNNEFILVKNSENKNLSVLLISYILFYHDRDGVKSFDSGTINSFSIILEKFVGGNIVTTPEGIINEFNMYFSRYRPKIKKIHEYFGKSQINFREFKNPIIVLAGIIFMAFAITNIDRIISYISEVDTDTVVKIAALIIALPTGVYYVLKIFGKIT